MEVLSLSCGSQCSDPRDRIFANLGVMVRRFTDFCFAPDYTQAVSAVYQDFFREWMNHTGKADLLGFFRSDTRLISSPSWAPNWNSGISNLRLQNGLEASGSSLCYWRFIDPDILELAGVVVATVEEVTTPSISGTTYGDIVANIRNCAPDSLEENYLTGCTALETYTTVLRMNYLSARYIPRTQACQS